MTFTVGFDQKDIVKAAISKVGSFPSLFQLQGNSCVEVWICLLKLIKSTSLYHGVKCGYSFSSLQTGQLFFSTMMGEQVNGKSLTGLSGLFMSVQEDKVNGRYVYCFQLYISPFKAVLILHHVHLIFKKTNVAYQSQSSQAYPSVD